MLCWNVAEKTVRCFIVTCLVLIFGNTSFAETRALKTIATHSSEEKRIALVIGNGSYQDAPTLANPANDARSMAIVLNKLGFDVTEVTNATQKEMFRAISKFGEEIQNRKSVALFYYAGHGVQMKGKNYLVPIDAEISGESAISSETVEVDSVLAQLDNSTLSIIILDACRNNPFQRARSLGSGGLAQMDAPKGSFIAYATSPGKTAADGESGNGLYTRELLKYMQTPGISLEEVFKRVRVDVARASNDFQIPWESTSLTGSFYFNGNAEQRSQFDQGELAIWASIRSSNKPSDYESYLAKYPAGQFSEVAKSMISSLKESARREAESRQVALASPRPVQQQVKPNTPVKNINVDLLITVPSF
jgi:hypothetical protein